MLTIARYLAIAIILIACFTSIGYALYTGHNHFGLAYTVKIVIVALATGAFTGYSAYTKAKSKKD